ncbi:hybrid sensor histidine kinase/response regulator [Geothrix fermentans]|uniref:hybrid sensor histidine kinase/response regulator n=1 Tax=Geothrix fermentans TaxID=44676 RepID=UPI00042262B8|nr:PAS domain S-box protein [Geothrix fermentans]
MHPPGEPRDPAEALALVRRYLKATYRIAEAALRATDLQELYARVHAIVRDLMTAENLYFALWDRPTGTVSFPYFVDEVDPAPAPRKLKRGLTEYVLRTERPLLLSPELSRNLVATGEVEPQGTDCLDWLGVPLVGTEGTFGVLAIQIYEGTRRYTPEERDLLVFVSGQVAMAIERKAAEDALRLSEAKFSRAFQASPDAINLTRLEDGTYLDVSEGFTRLTGWTREEAVGRTAPDLRIWADPGDRDRAVRLIQEHGEFTGLEAGFRRKDGGIITGLMSGKIMEVGGIPCLLSITRDITDRMAAEQALRAERGLFVGGPVMVIKWRNAEGWPVDYVSPNIQAILGYAPEELTSGRISYNALVHPDELEAIHRTAAENKTRGLTHYEQQYRLRTASGEYRWFFDFSASVPAQGADPGYHLGYILDITDRRRAEEALRQAQKLESLGVLAGGIAHDFNNLLTVVLGNLNLAQLKMTDASPARPYLANMEAAVLRATELTKQMLAYSGRGHFEVRPHDLNAVVRDLTQLLEVSISKKVRLQLDLAPDLPPIQADAAQFQQVVMNLVTNASDAIGDRDGSIHIATSARDLDAAALRQEFRIEAPRPGRHVILEVQDTGCGMSPDVLDRIFDPFFTTKAAGRGLGLSAMQGILRGHGAGLSITSQVGWGTRFRLCFPAADRSPAVNRGAEPTPAEVPSRGTVLLVDDEEQILRTTAISLELLGFQVVVAGDGLEALARFREHRQDLSLVLMDITMPRLDGREAFRTMRGLDPAIPVVLCSGFTEQDSLQAFPDGGPAGFLQKPYQLKDLKTAIRGVLGR